MQKSDANFVAIVFVIVSIAMTVTCFFAGLLLFNFTQENSMKFALACTAVFMVIFYIAIDHVAPKK